MADTLKFSVSGTPKAKGRARAHGHVIQTKSGPRAAVRLFTDGETARAERIVRDKFKKSFEGHIPWTGPILLQFTAVFEIPASFTKAQRTAALQGKLYHTSKPDKDNVEKLILDALNGIAWVDDSQVMGGGMKRYGVAERIDVTLRQLEHVGNPADKRRADKIAQGKLRL